VNRTTFLPIIALVLAGAPLSAQGRHYSFTKSPAADAPQWHPIYTDSKVAVSIDPHGTIKHKDGTYTTHLRWTYTADQPIGRGKSYRVMREVRIFDCKSVSTKTITANVFDADGKLVSSFDTPAKDVRYLSWEGRKAGTSSANALDSVCRSLRKS
jgi:hypothetical protein